MRRFIQDELQEPTIFIAGRLAALVLASLSAIVSSSVILSSGRDW
jgi:hypothetical protein